MKKFLLTLSLVAFGSFAMPLVSHAGGSFDEDDGTCYDANNTHGSGNIIDLIIIADGGDLCD